MPDQLTKEIFDRQVHTRFTVHFSASSGEEAELLSCQGGVEDGFETFSLVFRAAHKRPYPQRIYRMEHAEMGQFDIFIVPIRLDKEGVYYEAVFNNPVRKD